MAWPSLDAQPLAGHGELGPYYILLLAFAKMSLRTPAKTVNCYYDPASYEDFIRLYSGEIAGFLEKYNESTQLVAGPSQSIP